MDGDFMIGEGTREGGLEKGGNRRHRGVGGPNEG